MIFDIYGCVVCGGIGYIYDKISNYTCPDCSKTGGHFLDTEGIDCEADLAMIVEQCPVYQIYAHTYQDRL